MASRFNQLKKPTPPPPPIMNVDLKILVYFYILIVFLSQCKFVYYTKLFLFYLQYRITFLVIVSGVVRSLE